MFDTQSAFCSGRYGKIITFKTFPISDLSDFSPCRRMSKISSSKENTSSLQYYEWYCILYTVKKILFAVFTRAAPCTTRPLGKHTVILHFAQLKFVFPPCWAFQVLTQALHGVKLLLETLYLTVAFKSRFPRWHRQVFPFLKCFSRSISFPMLDVFTEKTGPLPQDGSFIPEHFQSIYRIFPNHRKHFPTKV